MKYWVHQNGRTIGPLDADALLDLAENDSLVSHGDRWVSLTDHPDFSYIRSAVTVLGSGESAIDRTDPRCDFPPQDQEDPQVRARAASDIRYWVLDSGSRTPTGPMSREAVENMNGPDVLVSHGNSWMQRGEHPDFIGNKVPPWPDDVFGPGSLITEKETAKPNGETSHRSAPQRTDVSEIPRSTRRLLLACAAVIGSCVLFVIGASVVFRLVASFTPVDPWESLNHPPGAFEIATDVDQVSGTVDSYYMSSDSPRATGDFFRRQMKRARGWHEGSLLESAGYGLTRAERLGVNLVAGAFENVAQTLHYRHSDGRTMTILIVRMSEEDPTMYTVRWEDSSQVAQRRY